VACVIGVAACGGADPGAPEAAATAFTRAVASGDSDAACALLSPTVADALAREAGSCPDALRESPPPGPAPVVRASRYGHQALVVTAGDALFLSEFPGGWKVVAAGCAAQGGSKPYDCTISGG
jgi:hypothetical protein